MRMKSLLLGAASVAFAAAASASYTGYTDTVNQNGDGVFRGWICNPQNPSYYYGGLVKVLIYRNGRYVGRTTNFTEERPDAAPYCGGNPAAGWRFTIPTEEYNGAVGAWVAKIDLGSDANEQLIPYAGGGTVLNATLPFNPYLFYTSPTCYNYWETPWAFSTTPASVLNYATAYWGFGVKVNGVVPTAEVTNWNGGIYTGTTVPNEWRSYTQRGDNRSTGNEYQDTLLGRSMLQVNCTSIGFMLNNFWLDDTTNPAAQYGLSYGISDDRKLAVGTNFQNALNQYQPYRKSTSAQVHRPFATAGTSLVIQADVVVPNFYIEQVSGAVQVGQANFYLVFWDTQSGKQLQYVLGIWDSRSSLAGGGATTGGFDIAPFVGQSANYTNGPFAIFESGQWTPGTLFSADRHFRARVTQASFLAAVNQVNSTQFTNFSTDLSNYVLIDASVGIETTGPRLSLSASARNVYVYMTRY